jgi:acyl-CoA thioester hydrolase
MISHEIKVRVRYAETDQMGYVYYGNYATYFEVARVETFRSLGFSYKEMEDDGILMPVLELQTKYIRPIFYDEEITVAIKIKEKPGVRIRFEYEVFNHTGDLTTVAHTTLVFVNKETGKPTVPTGKFAEILNACNWQ